MSGSAVITINGLQPTIITQPAALQTVCANSGVTFSVSASADGTGFQWFFGGQMITGATQSSYTIPSVSTSQAGNYDVVVMGTCGSTTSNTAVLVVNAAPGITSQPLATQTVCTGSG